MHGQRLPQRSLQQRPLRRPPSGRPTQSCGRNARRSRACAPRCAEEQPSCEWHSPLRKKNTSPRWRRGSSLRAEIAVFRAAVEDIAKTPEGVAALARFNAGDEMGALAVLDDLRAARDAGARSGRTSRVPQRHGALQRWPWRREQEARSPRPRSSADLKKSLAWTGRAMGLGRTMRRLYLDAGRLPDALRVGGRRPLIPRPT